MGAQGIRHVLEAQGMLTHVLGTQGILTHVLGTQGIITHVLGTQEILKHTCIGITGNPLHVYGEHREFFPFKTCLSLLNLYFLCSE